jgi:hypothetical protein
MHRHSFSLSRKSFFSSTLFNRFPFIPSYASPLLKETKLKRRDELKKELRRRRDKADKPKESPDLSGAEPEVKTREIFPAKYASQYRGNQRLSSSISK